MILSNPLDPADCELITDCFIVIYQRCHTFDQAAGSKNFLLLDLTGLSVSNGCFMRELMFLPPPEKHQRTQITPRTGCIVESSNQPSFLETQTLVRVPGWILMVFKIFHLVGVVAQC